ncbi:RNA-binding CRS1 / YhbY (CRM) domain-containing protein [Actinidia rufa]|uniref:RNA-binding CRS1 / YhbY (CRM) domain-containing protein n=1 Tax=Actinidia rufa TaxID=165716 RepID=A0A7J0G2D7_9ERIC|nr:RNA-binding CRS1 / YhbY (CRM) domain-containing protein [Actinidia rufa]
MLKLFSWRRSAHQTLTQSSNSDLPFDFKYSYSETNPSVEPIGFRESPRFSPFGPGRLDRKWTGTYAPAEGTVDSGKLDEERNAVLGQPLSEEEVALLVERYRHSDCSRQINMGTLCRAPKFPYHGCEVNKSIMRKKVLRGPITSAEIKGMSYVDTC